MPSPSISPTSRHGLRPLGPSETSTHSAAASMPWPDSGGWDRRPHRDHLRGSRVLLRSSTSSPGSSGNRPYGLLRSLCRLASQLLTAFCVACHHDVIRISATGGNRLCQPERGWPERPENTRIPRRSTKHRNRQGAVRVPLRHDRDPWPEVMEELLGVSFANGFAHGRSDRPRAVTRSAAAEAIATRCGRGEASHPSLRCRGSAWAMAPSNDRSSLVSAGRSSGPGVCDGEIAEAVEVAGVAGDHSHVVVKGGGGDECVSEWSGVRYVQRR
jgi:hypothetical protein